MKKTATLNPKDPGPKTYGELEVGDRFTLASSGSMPVFVHIKTNQGAVIVDSVRETGARTNECGVTQFNTVKDHTEVRKVIATTTYEYV